MDDKFQKYYELIIEWNKKFNLTRITDKQDVWNKHFLDCLEVSKYIKRDAKIIDIGSGAGFPGLVLAISRPDLNIVLCDSLLKRVSFLREVIKELELEKVSAIHARCEDLQKEIGNSFDVSTSRAVAKLDKLIPWQVPFLKSGGKMLAMKGKDIEEELKLASPMLEKHGAKFINQHIYMIKNTDITHSIVEIEKM